MSGTSPASTTHARIARTEHPSWLAVRPLMRLVRRKCGMVSPPRRLDPRAARATARFRSLMLPRRGCRRLILQIPRQPRVHFLIEVTAVFGLEDPVPGIGPD